MIRSNWSFDDGRWTSSNFKYTIDVAEDGTFYVPEAGLNFPNLQVAKEFCENKAQNRPFRCGMRVRPKNKAHALYHEQIKIIDVFPHETAGFSGMVLKLKIQDSTGWEFSCPFNEWEIVD